MADILDRGPSPCLGLLDGILADILDRGPPPGLLRYLIRLGLPCLFLVDVPGLEVLPDLDLLGNLLVNFLELEALPGLGPSCCFWWTSLIWMLFQTLVLQSGSW